MKERTSSMEIIIQDKSNKGFPIYNETVRDTAENWARGKNHTVFTTSDVFYGARLFDIDSRDCTGGNAWKIELDLEVYDTESTGHYEKVIFDLREEKLLEICQHEGVVDGIIKCPLVIVSRGQFAMQNGTFHKEFLASLENKKAKKISPKQLEIGGCYTTGSLKAEEVIYLGRGKQQKNYQENVIVDGYVFADIYGENNSDGIHLDFIKTLKSPSMKVKTRQLDASEIIDNTINHYKEQVARVLDDEGSWQIDYYKKKVVLWTDIKEKLNK